ncbi:MAG: hypothetical protein HY900_28215, partial [Deltaproteobacteria bacterium]|nr:hypothetical protein [Deltaproteobacteria bacterium]
MANDFFQTLRQEHREVRQIFEKLMDEDQSSKRQQILKLIELEIVPHLMG